MLTNECVLCTYSIVALPIYAFILRLSSVYSSEPAVVFLTTIPFLYETVSA